MSADSRIRFCRTCGNVAEDEQCRACIDQGGGRIDHLNSAVFAALGYLDGLYDRGAIDAQGLEVRQELRAAIVWNADRPARTFGTYRPVTGADVQAVVDKLRVIPATIPPAERAQAIRDAVIEAEPS